MSLLETAASTRNLETPPILAKRTTKVSKPTSRPARDSAAKNVVTNDVVTNKSVVGRAAERSGLLAFAVTHGFHPKSREQETITKFAIFAMTCGVLAAIMSAFSVVPQLIQIYKSQHSCDINWLFVIFLIISQIMWFIYALYAKDKFLLFFACFGFVAGIVLLVGKILYSRNCEDTSWLPWE